jgi:hypothetical protein
MRFWTPDQKYFTDRILSGCVQNNPAAAPEFQILWYLQPEFTGSLFLTASTQRGPTGVPVKPRYLRREEGKQSRDP